MDYISFRDQFIEWKAFTAMQVKTALPSMSLTNLYRWVDKGYLIKLRNGHYAFSECLRGGANTFFLSQFMYQPSYISLETALSFYGLIPEAIAVVTSVTTQKTKSIENKAGKFVYRTVVPKLFWGYDKCLMEEGRGSYNLASLEKAILDYLYLNPFYKSEADLLELRFDDYVMQEVLDRDKLQDYASRFEVDTLSRRVELLLSLYL